MSGFDERTLAGLRVFFAVVDAGSFAGAGELLDMSQPGVSRAIARLEQRLGIRLFDRTTRAVALSEEGRRFHRQVTPVLAELEEVVDQAVAGAVAVRGRLRVGLLDPLFAQLLLAPRVETFLARYPQLQLELLVRDQPGDLVSEGIDLAIRFGEPPSSALVARKLLETRVLTVASPAYLRRHGRPATPQELGEDRHACIDFRDPVSGQPYAWEFHRGRKRLSVPTGGRLVVNDVGTMLHACLAGYGVAQMMSLGIGEFLAKGKLVELFPDWPDERFPLYVLYPSRKQLPAKTRAFVDFLVELCGAG
ncbi:LysR family transcriptional regulator [Dyella marensis]|uniref:DNA-binding transcriptional regulator, LysR family n=1 Tax=Dyella marensis TaxID=500610 RepID=A0A1I1XB41_9GAMM|nr:MULTISPECIES: LysR family transcriptional regulator [Dyella]SFE04552.1 DNA-binding transcriptional regulator, LysR family [Dyella marensis]